MLITIQDQFSRAVIDTLGAQLISLCDTTVPRSPSDPPDSPGKEYIWQRDPAYWKNCSPLLFPAVGNSRDDRTTFDGVQYEMPKHGFCKGSDFEVISQAESEATFRLTANEMTKKHYPYDFVLTLTYRLKDGLLSMTYQVSNPQDSDIHYCLGAHPGFVCPMEDGAVFEDYQLEFEQEEDTVSMVYDLEAMQFDVNCHKVTLDHTRVLPLSYDLFDQDAVYFDSIRSRKVSLLHKDSHKGVEVSYPGFTSVAFWTPGQVRAPLLCVEPWNGSAIRSDEDDAFVHKHGLQTLKGGETRSYLLEIRMVR